MKLTDDEKSMLDGNEGKAVEKAMELLVNYGEALGAERFVDTNNVTLLSGLYMYPEVVRNAVKNFEMEEIASSFSWTAMKRFLSTGSRRLPRTTSLR